MNSPDTIVSQVITLTSVLESHLMDFTSTSSTTHSFEVSKSLKEIHITFRLSRSCALGRN